MSHLALCSFGDRRRSVSLLIAFTFAMMPLGMRLDDLRAVVEVNFVAVVVGRVVAGGDDDARACAQITNGERKFRRRARAIEDEGIAAVLRRDFCRERGKVFREMARVVCDHDFGSARDAFRGAPLFEVGNEPLGRATDIVRSSSRSCRRRGIPAARPHAPFRAPRLRRLCQWCARANRPFQTRASCRNDRFSSFHAPALTSSETTC